MLLSIITPSFRNSAWLKLCIASVADQQGVQVEHIVQDSCSDDGTQEWLAQDPRVKAFIEKDSGMYDAVNRGYRRASGEIFKPGAACRRLYSLNVTLFRTSWTTAAAKPRPMISSGARLCNT